MAYTRELLEEILLEGGADLLEDPKKYTQRTRVSYRCSCGTAASKRFEMLKMYRLPYCVPCSKKHSVEHHKQACIRNIGVDNPSKSPDIKQKIKEAFEQKYGDHPKRITEVQERWKQTCLEKYGGHPNQNREVQTKSEFKGCHYKTFVFPSCRSVKVQGYEHLALNKLLESVQEEDIVVGKAHVPMIEYWINEKKHVYFPDIFLPSENRLIEVKSEWSLRYPTHVEEKAQASVAAGYAYEIWVFSGNQKLLYRSVYMFDGSKETLPA